MGLRLQSVSPARGWLWITRAIAVWRKRPLSFVGLFTTFLLLVLALLALVPVLGGLLGMALVPLLSLGFMIATRSTLAGGPVNALMLIDGLRTPDTARRKAQITLCLGYALASVTVIALCDWLDGGALETLMKALSEANPEGASPAVAAAVADPMLAGGLLLRTGFATLLSIPFWHAPALVHWDGQSAVKALFSSTLAMWRARAAFGVYALGWVLVMGAASLLSLALVLAFGARAVGFLALLMGLALSALFYVSLWFSYADSFDHGAAADQPAAR